MTELSPAAQAVRNAAGRQYAIDGDLQDSIAAALRAAAEQVVSSVPLPCADFDEYERGFLAYHSKLFAIATELENQ